MRSTKLLQILTLFIACGQPSTSDASDETFYTMLREIENMINHNDEPDLIRGCIASLRPSVAQNTKKQKELDQLDCHLSITKQIREIEELMEKGDDISHQLERLQGLLSDADVSRYALFIAKCSKYQEQDESFSKFFTTMQIPLLMLGTAFLIRTTGLWDIIRSNL